MENRDLPGELHLTKEGTLGDLLLVIDMQNVYLRGQPWACRMIEEVQENIIRLLESEKVDNIIFTRYLPSQHPVGRWQEYNRLYADINANPWMSKMVEELLPYTRKWPVYDKTVYSSYSIEQVRTLASKADRILIAGVVAECCVLSTVISAVDAGDMVIYLKDAVAGMDEVSRKTAEQIVGYFAPLHTVIMSTQEYICE